MASSTLLQTLRPDHYRVSIEFPKASGGYYRYGESPQDFLVAEYRLPEYQVSLNAHKPEIFMGETATFELEGKYFFGGPVSERGGRIFSLCHSFPFRLQRRRLLRFHRS